MLAASTNVVVALVLAIVGAVLAAVVLVQSKFVALIGWAALAVAVAVIFLTIKVLG